MAEHKISDEVMANTELLAKLALTDEEREKSRQEMEKILGYVDKLNELDTEGVEPLISLFPVENVFREDKVVNGDMRDELVDLAPRKKDGQYLVPKTVEKGGPIWIFWKTQPFHWGKRSGRRRSA